ncbi:MAG TPA: DUF3311 domain-containing protein [Actinopolymorphaceae bacterium]
MKALSRGGTPAITRTRVLVSVLLVLPFVGMLWVSSYTYDTPRLGGFPFFYWYQLLWIFLSALFTLCAYILLQRERAQQNDRIGGTTARPVASTDGSTSGTSAPTDQRQAGESADPSRQEGGNS